AARAQDLVRSSHALWDLAEPVVEAGRLAGKRLDVRPVGALGARVGCPPITAKLSLRGRRADLCGIWQHGGFRSARAARCRDCCRRRPASPLLSRLEQPGFAAAAAEFLCHWRYPA